MSLLYGAIDGILAMCSITEVEVHFDRDPVLKSGGVNLRQDRSALRSAMADGGLRQRNACLYM